jgi:hypothetical protein
MNQCRDCKHWGSGKSEGGEDLDFDSYIDMAGCSRIRCPGDPNDVKPPAALQAYGYEWEDAVLWTSPDFGCVLWESE